MPATEPPSRTGVPARERALRSKLAQIVSGQGLIRGTLLERRRACGNPGCHCAKGPGHPGLYLILSAGKRQRQLYIPKDWHQRVRQWVDNHRQARALIHEISEIHWNNIHTKHGDEIEYYHRLVHMTLVARDRCFQLDAEPIRPGKSTSATGGVLPCARARNKPHGQPNPPINAPERGSAILLLPEEGPQTLRIDAFLRAGAESLLATECVGLGLALTL